MKRYRLLCFEMCLTDFIVFCSESPGRNTYQDGVNFIRQKFVGLNRNPSRKTVYTHVTCATDTHNIQYVFQSCTEIIISEHLRDAGLVWVLCQLSFSSSQSLYLPLSHTLFLSLFPLPLDLAWNLSLVFASRIFLCHMQSVSNVFHHVSSFNICMLYHNKFIAWLSFYLYWKSVILCDSPIVWLLFHHVFCIYFPWLCLLYRNYEDNQSCLIKYQERVKNNYVSMMRIGNYRIRDKCIMWVCP